MRRLNWLATYTGGILIACIAIFIILDVLSRVFIGRSIPGATEVIGICLAVSIFLGFSPCESANSHAKVDMVVTRLTKKPRLVIAVINYVLALSITGLMTWRVGIDALTSLQVQESLPTTAFFLPVYPGKILAAFGVGIFFIQLFRSAIAEIKAKQEAIN